MNKKTFNKIGVIASILGLIMAIIGIYLTCKKDNVEPQRQIQNFLIDSLNNTTNNTHIEVSNSNIDNIINNPTAPITINNHAKNDSVPQNK